MEQITIVIFRLPRRTETKSKMKRNMNMFEGSKMYFDISSIMVC